MNKKSIFRLCWMMAVALALFQVPKLAIADHGEEDEVPMTEGNGLVFGGCNAVI